MKKLFFAVVGLVTGFFATAAHAVIDVTAATGGVLDAQVAILSVIGALMTMATVAFGISKVLRFLEKRSGI